MNSKVASSVLFSFSLLIPVSAHAQKDVSLWLTNPDRSALFQLQAPPIPITNAPATNQIIDVDSKKTYQSQLDFGGRIFLVRAIVAEDVVPNLVVTVYRTSKISKYWRTS